MNLTFLLLVWDYFRILRWKDAFMVWGLSIVVGFGTYNLGSWVEKIDELAKSIASNAISLLGILIGFSIAVLTLLTTSSSTNVDAMKTARTDRYLHKQELSLYDLLVIQYSYSVVAEVTLVIANLLLMCAYPSWGTFWKLNLVNAIDVTLLTHVLLLTIKNITDFYFVLRRPAITKS